MKNIGFIAIALLFVGCSTSTSNVDHNTHVTDEFRRFMILFSALNTRLESQTGNELFSGAEDMGNGMVHVSATDAWLSRAIEDKTSNLNIIYMLWETADKSGRPITLSIRDARGQVVAKKSGRYQ